jgi:hypothetical protein
MCKYNNKTKKINIQKLIKFKDLMTNITKNFELNPNESTKFVRLSYNDLEGDTISIEDDEDLQLFFNTSNDTEKFVHIISKANN